jgi:hypothetical protein
MIESLLRGPLVIATTTNGAADSLPGTPASR